MQETLSPRADNEVDHGRRLAMGHPEAVWGWGSPAGRLRADRRAGLIARGARLAPGVRALELGCGTGLFTEKFARSGAHIVAVDISEELLDKARERGLSPDRVQFLAKRFEDCDVDGPFDAVIGSSVLHHLEVELALPKIYQLLKPGGVMCFAEPNMLNPQIVVQKNVPWVKERLGDSPDETAFIRWSLKRLMRSVGFEDLSVRPFDWLHPATPTPLIPFVQRMGDRLERLPGLREFAGSLYIRGICPART